MKKTETGHLKSAEMLLYALILLNLIDYQVLYALILLNLIDYQAQLMAYHT